MYPATNAIELPFTGHNRHQISPTLDPSSLLPSSHITATHNGLLFVELGDSPSNETPGIEPVCEHAEEEIHAHWAAGELQLSYSARESFLFHWAGELMLLGQGSRGAKAVGSREPGS
ncbi:hypothetical protein Drorol1_Dr00000552 [Drosera rotundifolia]